MGARRLGVFGACAAAPENQEQCSAPPPAASTFVIGGDGVIRFASVSGDYRWRVGPDEVLAALRG
jgi:hypothetical protein